MGSLRPSQHVAAAAAPAPVAAPRLRMVGAGCRSTHVGSLQQARIPPQPAKLLRAGRVPSRSAAGVAAVARPLPAPHGWGGVGGAGSQAQNQCQAAARQGPARSCRVSVAVPAFPGALVPALVPRPGCRGVPGSSVSPSDTRWGADMSGDSPLLGAGALVWPELCGMVPPQHSCHVPGRGHSIASKVDV